jgi:hypothetical protein
MSEQDSATRQTVANSLLASGFPFQTAIAEAVQQVPSCKILQEEFPWRDDTGVGFLDLIANKHDLIVAIECKKTQKEILTFLQPSDSVENVVRSRCLYVCRACPELAELDGSGRAHHR